MNRRAARLDTQWRRRRRLAATALVALLTLAGCAMVVEKPEVKELLWPPAPLTSRIKFVGVVRNADDLGRGSGELLADALLGRKTGPQSLNQPMALAPSRDGSRLYVTDYGNRTVFVFDLSARRSWFLGAPPHDFKRPFGIAVDDQDRVYVVDSVQRLVRVFDAGGTFLRDITHESLERPTGIALDLPRRRIYVADSASRTSINHVVHVFDADGTHVKAMGARGLADGRFLFPTHLAVDGQGRLYVTDTLHAKVQVFDPDGRHLMNVGQHGDGFGMFDKPKGVALDSFGNLYVADSTWSNVQIFNAKGQVLLYFAGNGRIPGLLFNPNGIAVDRENRIYVADTFNGRVAIYQLINTRAEDSFLAPPSGDAKGGDPATASTGQKAPGAQGITRTEKAQ